MTHSLIYTFILCFLFFLRNYALCHRVMQKSHNYFLLNLINSLPTKRGTVRRQRLLPCCFLNEQCFNLHNQAMARTVSKAAAAAKKASLTIKKVGKSKVPLSSPSLSSESAPINNHGDVSSQKWKLFLQQQENAHIVQKFVGAHISAAGGVENAPQNCFNIAGQAFACFLKNQRSWAFSPLTPENIEGFKTACHSFKLSPNLYVLPHGSYLINMANPDPSKREKSYGAFLEDIRRCEALGIRLYNFHPGSTVGECSVDESISFLADAINRVHTETANVICVVENMAGQKNMIGSNFEDLKKLLNQIIDKTRIGICLDTCHLFAAGYDIRTAEKFDAVLLEFDKNVGLHYLMAIHLNDSKAGLNSGLDRHENIGKGQIGLECFQFLMNDSRFSNMPLILETPDVKKDGSIWRKEIQQLYQMIKKK